MNKATMFMGARGIIEAYEKTLQAKSLDTVCLSGNYGAIIGDYYEKQYAPKLEEKKIKIREILPDMAGNREYALKKDKDFRLVKFLKVQYPSESDLIFYEDKVVLVSFDKEAPWAMEISDENIVKGLKNQFEEMWGRL